MKRTNIERRLHIAIAVAMVTLACGKKETTTEPDWSTGLIGRWTGQVSSESNGDKILEVDSVTFYKTGSYRWEYTYKVNGVADQSKGSIEEGSYSAGENTVVLTPKSGDPRELAYELTGQSDILLILRDGQGKVWNFTEVWFPSQSK